MKNRLIIITLLILFFGLPISTFAAGNTFLSISSSKKEFTVGDQVILTVSVVTPDQAMNATSGSLVVPANLTVNEITKQNSIINFWTEEPHTILNKIHFEGVALNPGYQGKSGKLFTVVTTAKKSGSFSVYLTDGAILANDGLGTNILDSLGSFPIIITEQTEIIHSPELEQNPIVSQSEKSRLLPIITKYTPAVEPGSSLYVKGIGEPNATTKIVFKDVSAKSLGERFITFLQTEKKQITDSIVQNNTKGEFIYTSPNNLVAGAYEAIPFLVDTKTNSEVPGTGVHLLVNDSQIVHYLVIFINILALFIPIVGLGVIIYFIPWYSRLRMRVLKRKIGLEEEEIELTEHQLQRKDKMLGNLPTVASDLEKNIQ